MKIAVFSPYLDTFGGGERYMMTIAEAFSLNNTVEVFLDAHLDSLGGNYLKEKLSKRFNLNLSRVSFIKAPVGKGSGFFQRLLFLRNYDLLISLTDGSIFYPTAKKNILHIQSPLAGQPAKSVWGKIKLKGWDLIIYNSKFTQKWSEGKWLLKSKVVYPPVDMCDIRPLKKRKYILSVGRFFGFLKDKKQEILIKAFKSLYDTGKADGWSLHLVGSAGHGDEGYIEELKNLANGMPVTFYPNMQYGDLVKMYGEASLYWHAAGFGEDDPTKMEHFGISVVEAMAGGCVPVVINKGGLTEIVTSGESGFLWDDLEELQELTIKLISDNGLAQKMSKQAIEASKKFNKDNFIQSIRQLSV